MRLFALSAAARSMLTLRQVDDYPLYVIHRYGATALTNSGGGVQGEYTLPHSELRTRAMGSLFLPPFSPAVTCFCRKLTGSTGPPLLLFTDPPDGYPTALWSTFVSGVSAPAAIWSARTVFWMPLNLLSTA